MCLLEHHRHRMYIISHSVITGKEHNSFASIPSVSFLYNYIAQWFGGFTVLCCKTCVLD